MELLDLLPPDHDVQTAGIYVIDDDGNHVLAGPFHSEAEAIAWIDHRPESPHEAGRRGDRSCPKQTSDTDSPVMNASKGGNDAIRSRHRHNMTERLRARASR